MPSRSAPPKKKKNHQSRCQNVKFFIWLFLLPTFRSEHMKQYTSEIPSFKNLLFFRTKKKKQTFIFFFKKCYFSVADVLADILVDFSQIFFIEVDLNHCFFSSKLSQRILVIFMLTPTVIDFQTMSCLIMELNLRRKL